MIIIFETFFFENKQKFEYILTFRLIFLCTKIPYTMNFQKVWFAMCFQINIKSKNFNIK